MKNRLTLVFSAAALFLSAGLLIWTLWGLAATPAAAPAPSLGPPAPTADPAPPADPAAAYRLEKLNEVSDMVLRREVVPEDYLRYLPEDLAEAVGQYNADTGSMKNNYTGHAAGIVAALLYERNKDPGDYLRGELFYSMVDRISTLALYRNADALCHADPVLSYILAKEAGGSYGLWAYRIHDAGLVGEGLAQQAEDYFIMLDGLFGQFDAARAALN